MRIRTLRRCLALGGAVPGCLLWLALLVSSSTLAAEGFQAQVDQLFAAYRAPDTPGCSLGVIRNGALILRRSYGAASLELGVPLSGQSVFYLASVSKQFTAASIVLAAEQGFLSLDDGVRKYVPELASYTQSVTLRQMLHHTSGFRDLWSLLELSGRRISDEHPKEELLDLLARQKGLNFKPGDEYQYSNTNYFLLAEVVERATRTTLAAFAEENIFRPLGMIHTRFYNDHTVVIPGRVPAYGVAEKGRLTVDWSTSFDTVGPGGVMSTVDDLFRWDRNSYDNRLGKGTLMQELQSRGSLNSGRQIGSVLGGADSYRGLRILEQAGSLFGYRSDILRFPDQRFTVICLCNTSSADPVGLTRQVADIYLADDLRASASPRQSAGTRRASPDVRRLSGNYLNTRDHSVLSFAADDRGLTWRGEMLRNISANRFQTSGGLAFAFKDSGATVGVTAAYDGNTWFVGERVPEFHPDDAALRSFSGIYASPELQATFKLLVEDGRLVVHRGTSPVLALAPLTIDEFENPVVGKIQFHRDSEGHVSGFSVFGEAIRNVLFTRERS